MLPVAVRGVDEDKVTETVQLARRCAGATVPGVVWLEDSWGLAEADDAARLAAIVGTTSTTRAGVREAAARAPREPAHGRSDDRGATCSPTSSDAGFISFQDVDGVAFDPTKLDGRSSRVLVVGGNATATPFAHNALPLVTALADSRPAGRGGRRLA